MINLQPRNEVERVHIEAIRKFGHEPQSFLLANQLEDFIKKFPPEQRENVARELIEAHSWSPSHYELVDFCFQYYNSYNDIRAGVEKTQDTLGFNFIDFKICTDPLQSIGSYVAHKKLHNAAISFENKEYLVIWSNAGLMNFQMYVIRRFLLGSWQGQSSIYELTRRLVNEDIQQAYKRICDSNPHINISSVISGNGYDLKYVPIANESFPFITNEDDKLKIIASWLQRATLTFIFGHEYAHIQLGHTGVTEHKSFYPSLRQRYSKDLSAEIESDLVGVTLMWDGCREHGVSIDETWLAPTIFFVSIATLSEILGSPTFDQWIDRCSLFMNTLPKSLKRLGFEKDRVDLISRGLPTIGALIHQWIHREWNLSQGINYEPNFGIYEVLKNYVYG